MKKLALIGTGGMVYDFIYEYTKRLDVELVAVSGEEEDCRRFAAMYRTPAIFADHRELLREARPELVIAFPSDEGDQAAVVRDCLAAGADVLCERPVCRSAAEGEALVELEKSTGRFVMPRYNRRYMPAYLSARRILASEEFGRAVQYHSSFHAGPYGSDLAFVVNHIGHHLDLARMLLGELRVTHLARFAESDRRVAYSLQLESEGGALCGIQANSFLCPDYPMEHVAVSGGNGRQVIVENVRHLAYHQPVQRMAEAPAEDFLAGGGTRVLSLNAAQLNNFTFYGFEEMLRQFVDCAVRRVRPEQGMADALETFRLIEATLKLREAALP